MAIENRQDQGPQPVLVLANSLGATQEMWHELAQSWQHDYRLVRLDYAGHGPDTPDALPVHHTVEGMGDEVIQRLDEQGVDSFDFIGLSLGGMLGLDIASRYPERVKRLVAANCRFWQAPDAQQQWDQRIDKVTKDGMAAIVGPTLERWFTAEYRANNPSVVERVGEMILGTAPEGYAAAATAVRDFDLRGRTAHIQCPVLLITGDEDVAAPVDHLEELRESIASSELAIFRHCAHISSIEKSAEFLQAVSRHLGK